MHGQDLLKYRNKILMCGQSQLSNAREQDTVSADILICRDHCVENCCVRIQYIRDVMVWINTFKSQ